MNKWHLFSSIFQIVVGIAAIIAYVVIATSGEPLGRWTITLFLAIAFVIIGFIGIVDWKKSIRKQVNKILFFRHNKKKEKERSKWIFSLES